MDPRKEAQEILRTRKPPRRRRAPHGQWAEQAKTVVALMETGKWNISDALRELIDRHKFVTAKPGTEEAARQFRQAFDGIRAAYYMILKHRKRGGNKPGEEVEV